MSEMVTIAIKPRTLRLLEKIQSRLERLYGKRVTYDDVIEFLVSKVYRKLLLGDYLGQRVKLLVSLDTQQGNIIEIRGKLREVDPLTNILLEDAKVKGMANRVEHVKWLVVRGSFVIYACPEREEGEGS